MSKFDTKTMYSFEKYLALQKSGEVNMASSEVQTRLGISKEEHYYIMENYNDLLEEYKSLKVVNEIIADAKARVEGKGKEDKGRNFTMDEEERAED